jgi:DnaK suppressor protein
MLELDHELHVAGAERASDAAERADREQADRIDMAESQIEDVTLREVEEAEERIAMGCYGLCIGCGSEIAQRRLLAHPTAVRCVACQSALERRRPRERV